MATILVVDDYPVITRMLFHILRHHGHTPLVAADGEAALALLAAEHDAGRVVDLVLTDVAMPRLDGIGLLLRLRADPRWLRLPVVVLTASGQDRDAARAGAAGADALLTKPAGSRELLETIARVLG